MDLLNLVSGSERKSCIFDICQLCSTSMLWKSNGRGKEEEQSKHTIESSFTPLAFPHALMTNASLYAITQMTSTPLLLNSCSFSKKVGMWRIWQVGVKAPGTETRTTFLSANSTGQEALDVGNNRMELGIDMRRDWCHRGGNYFCWHRS